MTSPWGNVRGIAYARGVSLPPRGSVQDDMLHEVERRNRNLRLAELRFMGRLVARGLDVPEAEVEAMLDLYTLELFQDFYRPQLIATLAALRKATAQRKKADLDILSKVDKFTVTDEDLRR